MNDTVTSIGLTQNALEDLERSNIDVGDVRARRAGGSEYAATGFSSGRTPDGYVIPYFDMQGENLQYYRIKVLEPMAGPKYRGMKDKPNHLYFPPKLPKLLSRKQKYVLITEGEKKAASAVAQGVPCIGLGGVDNWRTRNITFPETAELKAIKSRGVIQAKLPSGDPSSLVMVEGGVVAEGFHEFVDYVVMNEMTVIIVFDTDKGGIKTQVQRAAAQLGYELRYRGVPISRIRQMILPPAVSGDKVGLDDFIVLKGKDALLMQINATLKKRMAFPRHPNPKTFVATRLQKGRMTRKETQDVALSILMELETRGRRLRNSSTHDVFFFDEKSHTLLDVHIGSQRIQLHDTSFGSYLYREFNLSAVDARVVGWLAAQFHGEQGIDDVETHRTITRPKAIPDSIAYQLSDSHFVIITPDPEQPYIVCENGQHGVLFQQGQVAPIDHRAIEGAIEHYIHSDIVLWQDVLTGFNLNPSYEKSAEDDIGEAQLLEEGRNLATLLFYMSPWLLRWRGMQLPVEMTIGEPGSGKSSLYELRQTIISGQARLSNMTNDIKDWYAGITSQGGLHVLDNVHFTATAKDYRQRLSDELCRLVTEPNPHIEMRKLYTNAEVISLPVTTTFALTSIEQPFFTTDLIQRAAIFELQAISTGHNANWVSQQVARAGGRVGWVGHQLAIVHKFLRHAVHRHQWNAQYRAGHRLAHYEQGLRIMADVLGMDSEWIPGALKRQTNTKMSEADMVLAGMGEYINALKSKHGDKIYVERFSTSNIVEWAAQHETYSLNPILINAWKLAKYIRSHKGVLKKSLQMEEAGKTNNKQLYGITK